MLILIIPVSDVRQKHFRNMSAVNWSLFASISASIVPSSQGESRAGIYSILLKRPQMNSFVYLQVPLDTTEETGIFPCLASSFPAIQTKTPYFIQY